MQFSNESSVTYNEIRRILATHDNSRFLYTIEFFPEEGKYHMDGHRACAVVCTPEETKKMNGQCPVCHKPLTIGVMHRVDQLATRTLAEAKQLPRIPYRSLVPLPEIIADTFGCGVNTKKVRDCYDHMIAVLGPEFYILLHASLDSIVRAASADVARAVGRVRDGNIFVRPGYDGEFGIVKVFENARDRGALSQEHLGLE
jgi:PHP family Zn ribbon phosphoesterase